MESLRNLVDLGKKDAFLVGNKGAFLGELMKAGILVPPGFVISSSVFDRFLEVNGLRTEVDDALHLLDATDNHAVELASQKIRSRVVGAKIPSDMTESIEAFFKNLNSPCVAVRSSATAEDSAHAAWAGQLESCLNTTQDTLLENIKKCWASLYTPRAIAYGFEKKLSATSISVAVVVQKMVVSEKSGVAFSLHPVTGDANLLVIEAGYGLGEAIVSGYVTPDRYVLEKQSNPMRIVEKNVHVHTKGLYAAAQGGNEWRTLSREQEQRQVLSDEEILQLAGVVAKVADHFGFPVDVEWAFENGIFYFVQCRPVTALTAQPLSEKQR